MDKLTQLILTTKPLIPSPALLGSCCFLNPHATSSPDTALTDERLLNIAVTSDKYLVLTKTGTGASKEIYLFLVSLKVAPHGGGKIMFYLPDVTEEKIERDPVLASIFSPQFVSKLVGHLHDLRHSAMTTKRFVTFDDSTMMFKTMYQDIYAGRLLSNKPVEGSERIQPMHIVQRTKKIWADAAQIK